MAFPVFVNLDGPVHFLLDIVLETISVVFVLATGAWLYERTLLFPLPSEADLTGSVIRGVETGFARLSIPDVLLTDVGVGSLQFVMFELH